MVINRSVLTDAGKAFNKIFQDAWDKLGPQADPIEAIAMNVPSAGPSETYDFIEGWPMLREWLGPRVVKSLAAHGYTVVNKKWESTIGVKREDIEDDRLGVYKPKLQALGVARLAYAKLLTDILEGGFDTVCYDGQYFFDNDHPGAGAVQTNVTSSALASAAFWTGFEKMAGLTDEEGRPLGIVPSICMVGPAKMKAAKEVFKNERDASGATNTSEGMCEVVMNPFIKTKHWFLFDTTKGLGPLVLQIRKAMLFQMVLGTQESDIEGLEELDHEVFSLDQFFFGIRARHNAGYGLWQLGYGSNAST